VKKKFKDVAKCRKYDKNVLLHVFHLSSN